MNEARLSATSAVDLTAALLIRCGVSSEAADLTATALVDADCRGHHSHGLSLLPHYIDRIKNGGISVGSAPQINKCAPTSYLVNANGCIGMHALDVAARIASEEGNANGACLVGVRNNNHVGMLAAYRRHFQRNGTVGVIMNISGPSVAAPGGKKATIGSNALCVVVPRSEQQEPFCIDLGTGIVAAGKIREAAASGLTLPSEYLLDDTGKPTNDPTWLDRGGAIPVFGGHKGLAVHLTIEILAGAIAGGTLSAFVNKQRKDLSEPMNCSQLIIGISPAPFAGMKLDDALSGLEAAIRRSYDGSEPDIFFPNQLEERAMAVATRDGITVSAEVHQLLLKDAT
ncbi:Ldh family oxidoreductase [Sinorhizobium meliloti]|uniref:Ldh family oxidoreductase n=1 Tax=Rhizobium meliloti TaxID=382 RepID=UPI002073D090|nr:Ldh family oxidoreductase [Sinorhizobium meliloti]MCM5693037.1 Ldh family oxidoreductase [Sinorhizobium meliloti]